MEYNEILIRQRNNFNSGKTKDYQYRLKALKSLRASLVYYEKEINEALKNDLNKSPFETYITEYGISLQQITHAIQDLKKWMKPKRRTTGIDAFPGRSYSLSEPYGIVLIMSPWNYPIQLTMAPLVGAIAAGNCCIIKPSQYASATADVIARIIKRAFPEEYVTTILGGRKENQQLLEQRFDYIFFTGSVNVGKLVMEKAAKYLTPITLELGGKSPCIVTADANIKEAAKNIAFGKLLNSGQTCVGPDYVLIDERVKEPFCEAITDCFKKMIGDALTNKNYPRMINQKHFDRVVKLMSGVTVYSGGGINSESLQIEPTVLVDVKADSPVMGEEIFGPLLPIIPYKTLGEAETFVREREKPLALYLFTTSKKTEKRVLNRLSFGGGCVNDTIMHIMCKGLGFGGVGNSGMGMYHGKHSFETFSHTKGIYKKAKFFELPLRYHPYNKVAGVVARLIIK